MKLSEYLQYDGLGLAELVAKKHVSSSELLNLALQRAADTNPKLNAIIIPMHDYAKTRTQQALTGPFAGVPFLVKDLFQEYAGYPTSYGCTGLKRIHYIAEQNSEIVNRWKTQALSRLGVPIHQNLALKALPSPMLGVRVITLGISNIIVVDHQVVLLLLLQQASFLWLVQEMAVDLYVFQHLIVVYLG